MTNKFKQALPYALIATVASELGATEFYWRESTRSYTGFVAEIWFDKLPSDFSQAFAIKLKQSILVRNVQHENLGFAVSIPCTVPEGEVKIHQGQRNHSRARVKLVGDKNNIDSYYPALSESKDS